MKEKTVFKAVHIFKISSKLYNRNSCLQASEVKDTGRTSYETKEDTIKGSSSQSKCDFTLRTHKAKAHNCL